MRRIIIATAAHLLLTKTSPALVLNVFQGKDKQVPEHGDFPLQEALENPSKFILASHNEGPSSLPGLSAFGYWRHIGKVGMGSGVYLGDGFVLTSAHVGCFPFVMHDGSYYRPDYKSWRVLKLGDGVESDLAVFRVEVPETDSEIARLGRLPIAGSSPKSDDAVLMMGAGLQQSDVPVAMSSNGQILAVLGYHIENRRAMLGGFNRVHEVAGTPVKTGDRETMCFTTRFDRNDFEAQASDGDSGGATFLFDPESGTWALAGCIVAVSQKDGFVPFGSLTFLADLSNYRSQIEAILSGQETLHNQEWVIEPTPLRGNEEEPKMVGIPVAELSPVEDVMPM